MLSSSAPLSSVFTLSGDAAIEAVLADIPLFCEGIMGIGVFTFLFIAKQVKWPLVFLYGSSFLAFAAATLDLTQVLTRGSDKTFKNGSLGMLTGFVYSREIFLSLSLLVLNLYYWRLVALCPHSECSERRILSSSSSPNPQRHSASWDRWGSLGVVLKWITLAALLSVPLLQTLWRLLPDQRRYSSIYVADSVIQTTIMIILILKCGLNVYLSPWDDWWKSSRSYVAPVIALLMGVGLSIGNLVIFSFTETTLGRFLRAVEVYILFLHSLHASFQRAIEAAQTLNPTDKYTPSWDPEKSQFRGIVSPNYDEQSVPSILEIIARPGYQERAVPPRHQIHSWTSASSNRSTTRQKIETDIQSRPNEVVTSTPQLVEQNIAPHSATPVIVTNPIGIFGSPPRALERSAERPFTVASYYSSGSSSESTTPSLQASIKPIDISQAYGTTPPRSPQRSPTSTARQVQARSPFDSQPGSQQGSVTSFDELLRQQNELDKSIAALRLLSTESMTLASAVKHQEVGGEGNIYTLQSLNNDSFRTSKGEGSPSGRSEFSLSVFPEPPVASVEDDGSSDKESRKAPSILRRKAFNDAKPPLQIYPGSATMSSATLSGIDIGTERFNSATTQYDVTSFIGDLTEGRPPNNSFLAQRVYTGELVPDSGEPSSVTAPLGSAVTLRPMILASTLISANGESSTLPPSQVQEASPIMSSSDSPLPLRPLLLGRPTGSVAAYPLPGRMVPLAQRRERGVVITGAIRRPVIGAPQMNEESDAAPDAFERPRPPPLIIK